MKLNVHAAVSVHFHLFRAVYACMWLMLTSGDFTDLISNKMCIFNFPFRQTGNSSTLTPAFIFSLWSFCIFLSLFLVILWCFVSGIFCCWRLGSLPDALAHSVFHPHVTFSILLKKSNFILVCTQISLQLVSVSYFSVFLTSGFCWSWDFFFFTFGQCQSCRFILFQAFVLS